MKPGDDFYQYENGAWLARTAIPADLPSYTMGREVMLRVEARLHQLIENSAKSVAVQPTDTDGKVGAMYAAFMDRKADRGAGCDADQGADRGGRGGARPGCAVGSHGPLAVRFRHAVVSDLYRRGPQGSRALRGLSFAGGASACRSGLLSETRFRGSTDRLQGLYPAAAHFDRGGTIRRVRPMRSSSSRRRSRTRAGPRLSNAICPNCTIR